MQTSNDDRGHIRGAPEKVLPTTAHADVATPLAPFTIPTSPTSFTSLPTLTTLTTLATLTRLTIPTSLTSLATLAILTTLTTLTTPAPAAADAQVSSRLALGGGARFREQQNTSGLFDMALRAEALFGPPGDEHARIGPAFDLRTATFDTIEIAGGASFLFPTWRGYPIVLTAAPGWAARDGQPDRPIFVGTMAWGYRSYNFHSVYGFGLMGYVSTRVDLDGPRRWELTVGVEIDLALLVGVPLGFFRMLFSRGDPDEPVRHPE